MVEMLNDELVLMFYTPTHTVTPTSFSTDSPLCQVHRGIYPIIEAALFLNF